MNTVDHERRLANFSLPGFESQAVPSHVQCDPSVDNLLDSRRFSTAMAFSVQSWFATIVQQEAYFAAARQTWLRPTP